VWVGQANQFEQSASADEFDVIGDVTGFVYFTGGEAECLAIAKEMNDLTVTASFEEIAMRAYKPRKKRPMRVKRITPQERIDREKYRRKNRIKHAKNYMNIQKIRYKNSFAIDFSIEEEILHCCTVKLVVQPLLENAIYYGVEGMDGEGEIHVKGYRKEDDIYIEVSDNGLGMPQDMVEQLLTDNNRVRKHGSGVGVINVHNRIRLRFGKPYGLEIESMPDEGTTIRIHLKTSRESTFHWNRPPKQ
jgi:signal transduction histidine kinase